MSEDNMAHEIKAVNLDFVDSSKKLFLKMTTEKWQ